MTGLTTAEAGRRGVPVDVVNYDLGRVAGATPTQQTVNRALSAARAPAERGVARLKSWQIFRRARCSPNRMTSIATAVLTLERQR